MRYDTPLLMGLAGDEEDDIYGDKHGEYPDWSQMRSNVEMTLTSAEIDPVPVRNVG